ncbi:hypothetical protein FSP39_004731 [Pinctada imbricata]|uniref:BTB domain-containing protein n=1 Tax=Pinctada imbricata TaxID=66713 RepID=A0AA89BYQ7_PINIB|nr:hypothetical protein FSP39_004731 [Pinctada imbricata]
MPRTPAKVRAKRDRMSEYFQTLHEPPVRDSNESSSGGSQLRYSPSGRHVHISTVNLLYENSNFAVFRKNRQTVHSDPSTSHTPHASHSVVSSPTKIPDGRTFVHDEQGKSQFRRNADFSEFLYSLWKDRRMCDIVIKVNGQEIPAHKVALAAYSDKFTTRYCEQAPTTISEILLPNASVEAVQVLLDYIYTSDLNVNPQESGIRDDVRQTTRNNISQSDLS